MRRLVLLALPLALFGCDGGTENLDLAAQDLSVEDSAVQDLAAAIDASVPIDLSVSDSIVADLANPCDALACSNGGTCEINDGGAPSCVCPTGYAGATCAQNIDDCVGASCGHGTCVDGVAAYTCDCTGSGYAGARCSFPDLCATSPCAIGKACTPTGYACTPHPIDELGQDLCISGYPKNFIPYADVYSGTAAGCGTASTTVGIGYLPSFAQATFKTAVPMHLEVGDPIKVGVTTWASGSTTTDVQVSTSVNGTDFTVCGTITGVQHLGNATAHLVSCTATAATNVLYVRAETLVASPAFIYLRTFQLDLSDTCPTASVGYVCAP